MDTRQAILQALHDDPTDDASWLILGDWLEDHGEPERAELLRLYRRLRVLPAGPQRDAGEERLRALLAAGVRPCVPLLHNSLGMELALVGPGTFLMGSPRHEAHRDQDEEQHEVEITRPFYLGAYLVTQEQYRQVTGLEPSRFAETGVNKDDVPELETRDFPVENVSWNEAVRFCELLSELPAERTARRRYRLPTEAEWEYACRAGTTTPFHLGSSLSADLANFDGRHPYGGAPTRPWLMRTTPVGSYAPNALGLFDVHGNVREWCFDWYVSDYGPQQRQDPQGPETGSSRVVRGGSWLCDGHKCRCAFRVGRGPDDREDYLGLRVACVEEAPSAPPPPPPPDCVGR
jgi:uncharacterized protein (TIGR02996 family)